MIRPRPDALATQLPARYERLFAWRLDARCVAAREVAADLSELWQDLGGVEQLSAQKRWLCERVVFMRRKMIEYETAVMDGTSPPMDAGCYSNFANVTVGHLKALGLERQAKPAQGIREYLAAKTTGSKSHG